MKYNRKKYGGGKKRVKKDGGPCSRRWWKCVPACHQPNYCSAHDEHTDHLIVPTINFPHPLLFRHIIIQKPCMGHPVSMGNHIIALCQATSAVDLTWEGDHTTRILQTFYNVQFYTLFIYMPLFILRYITCLLVCLFVYIYSVFI